MSQEPKINFHTALISLQKRNKKLGRNKEKKKQNKTSKRKKRLKIKLQKKYQNNKTVIH